MTPNDTPSSDVIDAVVSKLSRMYGTPDFASFSPTYTFRFNRPYHCPFCGYETTSSTDVTLDKDTKVVKRERSGIHHDKYDCWVEKMRHKNNIDRYSHSTSPIPRTLYPDDIGRLFEQAVYCHGCAKCRNYRPFNKRPSGLFCTKGKIPIPVGTDMFCPSHEIEHTVRKRLYALFRFVVGRANLRELVQGAIKDQEKEQEYQRQVRERLERQRRERAKRK